MQRHNEELKKIRAQVVIVAFASSSALQSYQKIHQWKYPIFSDVERKFYHLLGLQRGAFFQIFHPKTMMNYARYLIEGKKIEKTKEDIYQLGGDFIFDRDGVYRFGYPSQRPDDRPSVSLLIQKLSTLHL
ncbi:MAG: AhpC/TSA family protein [Deltaproteobacteria bacterium]|nr:AhpC/TSA family protein [Deltaproteobacteria bacterium]MBI3016787.1 AhpC/TSA family protein [Deltaproteobacteria bacterium]